MARVLITWNRPQHLSDTDARAWVRAEVRRLAAIGEVESVSLSPVTGTRRYGPSYDWVCELHLEPGVPASAILDDSVCAEWLLDLRLLGMRPSVAILKGTEAMTTVPAPRSEVG